MTKHYNQQVFSFLGRSLERERKFKRVILLFTFLMVAGLLAGTAPGRYLIRSSWFGGKMAFVRAIGGETDRSEIEASWKSSREFGITMTRQSLQKFYDKADPALAKLMKAAGMAPENAVVSWGNFDWTLMLSSQVFEPDESGRSYRMKPNVTSIWLRVGMLSQDLHSFFLVPDTPAINKLLDELKYSTIPGTQQTTNSWGCRGTEPDPLAKVRGIVLGDSMMQGLMVGDDETPPICLQNELRERFGPSVSVLNTGHLGYSPEQYYFTLMEYDRRFRPHFVVIGLCGNDFGNGDWKESTYWLNLIQEYCRRENIICLTVPAPIHGQTAGRRVTSGFQGRINDISMASSFEVCDPMEDFVDAELEMKVNSARKGGSQPGSPLYNEPLNDLHFSPAGTKVWGKAVGRRVALLLNRFQAEARGIRK